MQLDAMNNNIAINRNTIKRIKKSLVQTDNQYESLRKKFFGGGGTSSTSYAMAVGADSVDALVARPSFNSSEFEISNRKLSNVMHSEAAEEHLREFSGHECHESRE